jgi:hypothetical protein
MKAKFLSIFLLVALTLGALMPVQAVYASGGTTIIVNTNDGAGTIDDGKCSLSEAIKAADNGSTSGTNCTFSGSGTPYTIQFSIGSGAQTISATSQLSITAPVIIDGTTQPGYSGVPLIHVDGSTTSRINGLVFTTGSEGSMAKGLMVTGFSNAEISIGVGNSTNYVTLKGNYIGTDGTNALGGSMGVDLEGGAYAQVGGPNASDRNIISGNSLANVYFSHNGDHNTIQGNYIGTNASGSAGISGSYADIWLTSSGTTGANANQIIGNVISAGSGTYGIDIDSQYDTNTVIQSNYIGTNAGGTSAIGNFIGIKMDYAGNTQIGGSGVGLGNLISGNQNDGIYDWTNAGSITIIGNKIGITPTGSSLPNSTTGIDLEGGASAQIAQNYIANNSNSVTLDATSTAASGPNNNNNCFINNSIGLSNANSGTAANFTNNWWGSSTGPNYSGNPGGTGDKISTYVTYSPWLHSAPAACGANAGLNPTSVNFGFQQINTTSSIHSVTLTNTGTSPLSFSSITSPAHFTLDTASTCKVGTPVAAGGTCTLALKFSPTALGAASGNVVITGNASNSPQSLPVSGTGVGAQLLNNASFEGAAGSQPANWTLAGTNANTDFLDCTVHKIGSCSLKLIGNGTQKTVSQTVSITGTTGNTYAFALSSEASGVPATGVTFMVKVLFYKSSLLIGSKTLTFSTSASGFQNLSDTYTAPSAFTKIVFKITFKAATGTVWFDAAGLYHAS